MAAPAIGRGFTMHSKSSLYWGQPVTVPVTNAQVSRAGTVLRTGASTLAGWARPLRACGHGKDRSAAVPRGPVRVDVRARGSLRADFRWPRSDLRRAALPGPRGWNGPGRRARRRVPAAQPDRLGARRHRLLGRLDRADRGLRVPRALAV